MKKIVAIIPARGGSKGVPRKNIKNIAGYPLIYWTIQAAKHSSLIHDFYVSTEDEEIAEIAIKYGAKVLIRPVHLSQDNTTTLEVLQHILSEISCDALMVLQPTSPLRDQDIIDDCIKNYTDGPYDTLATGYDTKILEYGTHKNMRRQDIRGFFFDDGNVYIIDKNVIERGDWSGDSIFRKTLPRECQFEIDDDTDFFICESLLRKRIREKKQPWDIMSLLLKIEMLVMDIDGSLTDAGMYYSEKGDELKKFNTRDGKGIELIRNLGLKTAIITSESTEIVKRRAEKLQIDHLHQDVGDKKKVIHDIARSENIPLESMAYIGDDINDLGVMSMVGFPVAVCDAADEVKEKAVYQTSARGGDGAVREICDLIVHSKNTHED